MSEPHQHHQQPATRVVRLYGRLGLLFGRVHHFAVATPAEAIRALIANFPAFELHLLESTERGVGYVVLADKEQIGRDELQHRHGLHKAIRIAPVPTGRAKGWGQILLGVVLVAAAIVFQQYELIGPIVASGLFSVGVSIALGGVAQLLSAQPGAGEPKEEEARKPSYIFDGAVNAVAQGHPVPVGYGEMIVGSVVVSQGIDVA